MVRVVEIVRVCNALVLNWFSAGKMIFELRFNADIFTENDF